MSKTIIWKDRKRTLFGLPWSFTKYTLTEDKLLIETGFLNQKQEEIRLYRIMDVTLQKSFKERIFKLGTIHCCSADKSTPEFDIMRIKNPNVIFEKISDTVEQARKKNRISVREIVDDSHDDDNDDDDE